MRQLYLSACVLALSGCATLSFAPPIVNQDRRLQFMRTQTFFGGICNPTAVGRSNAVKPNVDGALLLINNFILTYRCQRDRAAEGRQFFEVPSLIGSAAAGTALALGAGPAVAIAAGAGNIALTHGRDYYAPQAKAQVLADGLQAILCIQTEAVGVNPYVLQKVSDAQDVASGATTDSDLVKDQETKRAAAQEQAIEMLNKPKAGEPLTPDPTGSAAYVSVSYGRQYFEMIRAALFSVEQNVGQRLSHAGTPFDASGIIAEIEKLNQKEKDEKAAAGDATGTEDKAQTQAQKQAAKIQAEKDKGSEVKAAADAKNIKNRESAQGALGAISDQKVGQTIIKLDQLNTKLQKCVVTSKV